jgi:hypothetical protein
MSSVVLNSQTLLGQEWLCLQNQYDSYEKWSLVIKLTNIVLCCLLLASIDERYLVVVPVGIFWLQDAIWKTFQSRIGDRLLLVEEAIAAGDEDKAMQFNSQWLATRPGALTLITEYLRHALKPTVAYPHAVLVVLTVFVVVMV